jgi:hypothetical protein
VIDISFDHHQSEKHNKKLSVVISADSFLYGVFDDSGVISEVKYYSGIDYDSPESLINIREDQTLQNSFDSVTVCSKQLPVLHLGETDDQLCNYFPSFSGKAVFKEKFTGVDVYSYFGLNQPQMQFLAGLFTAFSLHHFSMVMADYYYPSQKDVLLAHFDEKWVHLFYANESGFRFYNAYPIGAIEDALYFILTVYRHLGLDPLEDHLRLSGLIDKESPLFKLLHGYIAYPEFESTSGITIESGNVSFQDHYYFDIALTALCV